MTQVSFDDEIDNKQLLPSKLFFQAVGHKKVSFTLFFVIKH